MSAERVTTVILGAGASYDAGDPNLPSDLLYRPPLTRELFDVRGRSWLGPLATQLPGVLRLLPELVRAAQSDTRGLESRLTQLAQDPNRERRAWFRDVPPFLQAQIHDVSRKYIKLRNTIHLRHPAAGNYHRLVDQLLQEPGARVVFITLNYDDFLEQALSDYPIEGMNDYANPEWPWRMVKIHGSINWFHDLTTAWDRSDGDFPKNWRQAVRALEMRSLDRRVKVVWDVDRVWEGRSGFLYPVLTVPITQKPEAANLCPAAIQSAAAEWLSQSTRTLIIGTSGHDEDLGLFLQRTMKPQESVHIVTKGGENEARQLRDRFWPHLRVLGDGSGMQVYTDGFLNYLWNGGFDTFLGQRGSAVRGIW